LDNSFHCVNPFCQSLDDKTRKFLCSAKVRFKLGSKQEGLFCIGEGQLILIDKGQIMTVRQRSDGKQKGIELLSSGDILGVSQLFGEIKPTTILISAKQSVEGCIFSSNFLEATCALNPAFSCAVLRNICRRFSEAINQIEHISLDDSTEKMIFTLNKINNPTNRLSRFTHDDLAVLAGMNRVTATKAIKRITHSIKINRD
jgi:CRP-like cAMP-binding protein